MDVHKPFPPSNHLCSAHNQLGLNIEKCDALRDLVAFVQFQKREKHPGGVLITKINTPP